MTKLLKKAAFAATVSGFVLGATPAFAQSATQQSANGTATVKIYSPLSIAAPTAADSVVDFGILVGTRGGVIAPRSANDFVIDATAAPTAASVCTGAVNWSCSGTPRRAQYVVSGSTDSVVNVWLTAGTIDLVRSGGVVTNPDDVVPLDLALSETVDSNSDGYADLTLSTGSADVYVGGTLHVSDTDFDGVYTGTFQVNADYQ